MSGTMRLCAGNLKLLRALLFATITRRVPPIGERESEALSKHSFRISSQKGVQSSCHKLEPYGSPKAGCLFSGTLQFDADGTIA